MSFVIVYQPEKGAPMFWNGHGFHDEYPDTEVFTDERRARVALKTAVRRVYPAAVARVQLIADYGFEHEMVIA